MGVKAKLEAIPDVPAVLANVDLPPLLSVLMSFAAFAAILAISPFAIVAITAIYALEVLVAFIQAYVFAILTCVYLKDALHPHH